MYGDKDAFIVYHEARGREAPGTWDDDFIEASLLVASEWLDNTYGQCFVGYKTDGFTQAREWPRTAAYTNTTPSHTFLTTDIPDRVVNAAYEAAWRHASNPGCLEIDYTPGKYKSVSVDGAVSVEFKDVSLSDLQMQIAKIDAMLWPLFSSEYGQLSGMSGSVTRA